MALTLSSLAITVRPAALVIAALAGGIGAAPAGHDAAAAARPAEAARPTSAVAHATTATRTATVAHPAAVTTRQQRAVARYWTNARMRHALGASPALRNAWSDGDTLGDGLRWVHGGAVTRTTGKVFFTLDGINYVCSGTAINSAREDVVLTAAHCTGNGPGDWASNWTFVPGYSDGAQPYGSYTGRKFYVSSRWDQLQGTSSVRSERYDVAFVTVNPASGSRAGAAAVAGQQLGQVTGSQPVSFTGTVSAATRGRDTYVFGYPSNPPFTGLYPNYCAGLTGPATDDSVSLPCAMTAGDSGGPWFTGFSPRTGTGTIIGISTYKYGNGARTLYGTLLGPDAQSLYQAADAG